jgi:primary-amine oxidase
MLWLLPLVVTALPLALALNGCATPFEIGRTARIRENATFHRRQTEEAFQASRAMRFDPPPPANNGIVQIAVDLSTEVSASKNTENLPAPPAPPPCPYTKGMKTASLVKAFPEVTWHVCVTDVLHKGLWVGPVHIRRTASHPWMRVLYQAGLADIFVPYHADTTLRFYDMRWTTWLDQVSAQDAGPNGSLITLTNETVPTVVAEVRDRGVAWLCKDTLGSVVRRGEEFVVWGVSDAGNYDNIIQIGFRDDGGMTFRMGNTGFNSQSHQAEEHSHNALWRIDMDLFDTDNSAYWLTHREPYPNTAPYLTARDFKVPFSGPIGPTGVEGARRWDYSQYASLLIETAVVENGHWGHRLGYEFTPAQLGMSRHYDPTERWTQNDVYVTVYHANQLDWLELGMDPDYWVSPDQHLLTHLNGEPVLNTDLVVWIKTSAHHHPSDEDRSLNDLGPLVPPTTGVTLVHWAGFNVEPHNLFAYNPLGGPSKCSK